MQPILVALFSCVFVCVDIGAWWQTLREGQSAFQGLSLFWNVLILILAGPLLIGMAVNAAHVT